MHVQYKLISLAFRYNWTGLEVFDVGTKLMGGTIIKNVSTIVDKGVETDASWTDVVHKVLKTKTDREKNKYVPWL